MTGAYLLAGFYLLPSFWAINTSQNCDWSSHTEKKVTLTTRLEGQNNYVGEKGVNSLKPNPTHLNALTTLHINNTATELTQFATNLRDISLSPKIIQRGSGQSIDIDLMIVRYQGSNSH